MDIVVVNYRTLRDLETFLVSVAEHPPATLDSVVVVDVDPVDPTETVETIDPLMRDLAASRSTVWVEHQVDSSGIYKSFDSNIGYGRACNWGYRNTYAPVVGFFNADVEILEDGSLDELEDFILSNPDVGVVGPRQVDSRNRITHAGIFGTFDAPRHRDWKQRASETNQDVVTAVTVSGAAYIARRSALDQLAVDGTYRKLVAELAAEGKLIDEEKTRGPFLPTAHYYDETLVSYALGQIFGYQAVYYGLVTMRHEWHQASPIGGFADRAMKQSRECFQYVCDGMGMLHD